MPQLGRRGWGGRSGIAILLYATFSTFRGLGALSYMFERAVAACKMLIDYSADQESPNATSIHNTCLLVLQVGWNKDRKDGATLLRTNTAADFNGTAEPTHDTLSHPQTEACTLLSFRREEWLEDTGNVLPGNTYPCVCYRDSNPVTFAVLSGASLANMNDDGAGRRGSFHCIHQQSREA